MAPDGEERMIPTNGSAGVGGAMRLLLVAAALSPGYCRIKTPMTGASHQPESSKKLPLPVNENWKATSMWTPLSLISKPSPALPVKPGVKRYTE